MFFLHLHKSKQFRTVAIAGQCAAAQLNLFEELTGSFICEYPQIPLKGFFYYKYNEYSLTCLPPDCSAGRAADFDCVIYVINPYRLENELVNALRFSRQAKRIVMLMCRGKKGKKIKPPVNVKLLSGVLGAEIVFETCSSSRGVNKLLEAVKKSFK